MLNDHTAGALDPSLVRLKEQMQGSPELWDLTMEQARKLFNAVPTSSEAPRLRTQDRTLTSDDGSCETFGVRIYHPEVDPIAVIAYAHGGGWAIGNLQTHDALCRWLAQSSRSVVIATDYRKAPERPFPAGLSDYWQVVNWIPESGIVAAELPLVVAGDSAGGNLAAVAALRAREAGGPEIRLQVLIYPATDSNHDRPSYHDPMNRQTLAREHMVWYMDMYAPGDLRMHPEVSPLRAECLAGLPPALVVEAEFDPLQDEVKAYARRLRADGVSVEERLFGGLSHGFVSSVDDFPAAREAIAMIGDHVARAVARRRSSE